MFCSLSVSCGAPRGQWKCQGHYIGSVHSERLKVSSCTQQDVQSDRSLFLQLAFEGKAEHQDVHLKDTHSKQTNAVQQTLTSSLASLRESSTSEKLKLATVMNWLTTDTNLSPYSWGRFFWNSSSCMRDRNCVLDLLLSLRTKRNHAALTLSTLFKPLRRLLISFSSSVMLERHNHRHPSHVMCNQECIFYRRLG